MNRLNRNYQPYLESLDKLGFCTFRVFEDETIGQLRSLYDAHFGEKKVDGLYASHNSNTVEKGLEISTAIKAIVSDRLQEVFPDYNYFLGHFMVKGAGVDYEFALHQDWNIVDESQYKSYQVWIPLQLTSPANGGMFVVPGSHHFFNNYRSGSYSIPVVSYQEDMGDIVSHMTIPAGGVLIYHNGLFHASHPNKTDEIRIAVIVNYVEKKAPTYFFQKNAEKAKTDLYAITGDTLIANLPDLEKGKISAALEYKGEVNLSPVNNADIKAADLIAQYKKAFPEGRAAQIKQIHVTVDPTLEQQINERGYVVLDILSEAGVQLFLDEYQKHFAEINREPGRFTTLQHTDAEMKKNIHDFIVANIDAPLRKYFKDYIIPVSQYYTKKAHTSGDIDLHADSTLLLNHQLEPHYAIWIPLVDVDERNGCLSVIPYSHRNPQATYGGSFTGAQQVHREWLRKYEIPIPLRAGQAIVFDNNLLHNSSANITDKDRVCFTFRMTHYASDFYSFISKVNGSKDLELYLEDHNYYMDARWDGEGNHIAGKFAGILRNGISDFRTEDLLKPID
jgi:ectoine hydroxylase-related dioxygenase (phytanoyl-CoA dioxygenase family)